MVSTGSPVDDCTRLPRFAEGVAARARLYSFAALRGAGGAMFDPTSFSGDELLQEDECHRSEVRVSVVYRVTADFQ
jgi:hypothetical protein